MIPTETPAGDPVADAPRWPASAVPGGPQLGVEHGHLERGLGHAVALAPAQGMARPPARGQVARGGDGREQERGAVTSAAPSTYSEE